MSAQTPTPTPKGSRNRKLPMIVDIAIDNNGKQLYQVHESLKSVRKEMPKSTSFCASEDAEKTPIRRILGTISPSTLNQKKIADSDLDEYPEDPESATRKTLPPLPDFSEGTSSRDDNDIWSGEIEQAFEEVLAIIPKNGLNKIKISGRSCGRNELISDYILTKTGKFRSRKQVSSHIQVIKNLGVKTDIIRLINDGPVFASAEEQVEHNRNFEKIFSKININKSLGFSEGKRKAPFAQAPAKKHRRVDLSVAIENFFISVQDTASSNPIILTLQSSTDPKTLRLKENANISARFPGLNDFQDSQIPIVHSMVNLQLPQLPFNYSLEGIKTNVFVKIPELAANTKFALFTSVYSFGNEVLKVNDDAFLVNDNYPFLVRFWKLFLAQLLTRNGASAHALKGTTIKQVLYEPGEHTSAMIPKLKVKAVLLWEFAKVDGLKDAVAYTSRIVLPQKQQPEAPPVEYTPPVEAYGPPPPQTTVQRKFHTLQQQQYQHQQYQEPYFPFQQYPTPVSATQHMPVHPLANMDLMMMGNEPPQEYHLGMYEGFEPYN